MIEDNIKDEIEQDDLRYDEDSKKPKRDFMKGLFISVSLILLIFFCIFAYNLVDEQKSIDACNIYYQEILEEKCMNSGMIQIYNFSDGRTFIETP